MNLEEIKQAVDSGKIVHWANSLYHVCKNKDNYYYIICISNDSTIGLTWKDGKTLNGQEKDFYIADKV